MGILSRLFSKQDEEALKRLEKQLNSIVTKSHATWVCIVGIKGKIKGLDIVNYIDPNQNIEKKEIQRINGRLVELYSRYQSLEFSRGSSSAPLQIINYYFSEGEQICIFPIEGNDQFIVTTQTQNPSRILKEVLKIRIDLYKLSLERTG
ncbi:MAG: hypothetical protein ACTSYI_01635 [Promethearchaeota archaeon]